MFNIVSILGLVARAPTVINSTMVLIEELSAGFEKAKATPGADVLVYIEDMMAALVAHKGALATAVLGQEPVVSTDGKVVTARK